MSKFLAFGALVGLVAEVQAGNLVAALVIALIGAGCIGYLCRTA